jgi:hypothetical protein
MNTIVSKYEKDLRPPKVRFWITATLLFFAAVACVNQIRHRMLQEKTYAELVRAKAGLDVLKAANANRRQTLAALTSQFGSGSEKLSPERVIYRKLDEIKSRFSQADLAVTAIERKGGEVSLPYTLKFSNYDYSEFLNAINYLQESSFPLTPVNSIVISQTENAGEAGVLLTLTGKVLTIDKSKP